MLPTVIAPTENLQSQSPFVQLPTEIKHIIYGLCFVSDHSIIDPIVGCTGARLERGVASTTGISLLQTCRRIYHDADRRPFFAHNTFRFTSADRVRTFFHSLPIGHGVCVQDVEIDVRRMNSDHPGLAREWLRYLAWGRDSIGRTSDSLRSDAVGLKCLRLNFEAWPIIAMFRTELWELLRNMLSKIEGLERIVVVGASKGRGMARKAPW
ncbi:Nn.00g038200.m01.CDS01 [Neocucurbitaria sp. VM-36]